MIGNWAWSAKFRDVPDGLSNTFMIGETVGFLSFGQSLFGQCIAYTAHPINWRNAIVLANPPNGGNPQFDEGSAFRSFHVGGAHFLMGDGSVRFISENIDGVTYRALASRAGGEIVSEF